MTDPIPINLAAIEAKQAQREAQQTLARQVTSADRFEESVDVAFNPAASEKQQARLNRFRSLDTRGKEIAKTEEPKIEEVGAKTEEDVAKEFNQRNSELPEENLRTLRRNLRPGATFEQILDDVDGFFKDPTLADEALEFLQQTGPRELQEEIEKARELLNEKKGREILAGRNVDQVAKYYHKKGLEESATALRDLYRDITGNPRDHNTLFSELSNKYPFDDLKLVVAFLLKGMGYDLKSKGPSIANAELLRLMTELRNLQSILWVYLFFKGRMKLIYAMFQKYEEECEESLTFEKLAKEFIKLVEERYPSILKLQKHMEKMGLGDVYGQIVVLSQYRDATRQLSSRLYKTPKQRQDLLLVILETLEELEDKIEEDEEESSS